MKKFVLFGFLILSGCAPYIVHQPDLASAPEDKTKYSKDLDDCRHQVFAKRGIDLGQGAAIGGLGLIGMAAYGKPPAYGEVDDCLIADGYSVIK